MAAGTLRQGMRQAIAAAMSRYNREIPHYYLEMEIDMSRPLRWLRFWKSFYLQHWTISESAEMLSGHHGGWAGRVKIAFIGVGVRRGVTMHGFALNVHPNLRAYENINPCGLPDCPVTSMAPEEGLPLSETAT